MTEGVILDVERSLRGQCWIARPAPLHLAEGLAQHLGVDNLVGRLLASRGVTLASADRYWQPKLKQDLPDPLALKDMEKAADCLAQAILDRKSIILFGDYDVDGATAAALMARYLRALGVAAEIYIPDRIDEGYGPTVDAMDRFARQGADLLLCLDCGTAATAPLQRAAQLGLSVIVADHHKAPVRLPPAAAIVNPNRLDETGPGQELAAVGVTFLLAGAVNAALRARGGFGADLAPLLDLVALGTVCDMVPLIGANRALVTQGLKVMAGRRNPGLAALSDVSGMESAPTPYHLGFLLGPRINAGGRIGQANLGAKLLATDDRREAEKLAQQLDQLNGERRAIEQQVTDQAKAQAALATDGPVILVAGDDWHPGVVGIVAGRLKEEYGKPAVVLSQDGDLLTGSARSITGVDIGSVIIDAVEEGLLVKGGGHAMAAGMTILAEQREAFSGYLAHRLAGAVAQQRQKAALAVDGLLSIMGASTALVDQLEQAGPYGVGNPAPRLVLADARITKIDTVGKDHLRLFVRQADGKSMKAMVFRAAESDWGRALVNNRDKSVHLAGRLKKDDWAGAGRTEFHVEDAAVRSD